MNNLIIYKISKYIISQKYIFITNMFLFLFYFSISRLTPYQGDDFIFKVNPLNYSIDLDIIIEAMNALWYWYNYWMGRLVGSFLLFYFLLPDKIFFDFVNSSIQVLIINIIFYLSKNRVAKDKLDSSLLLLINLLLFFGYYGYSTVFHMTSSILYSWTHMFSFLYYIYFLKHWDKKFSYKRNVFFFLFGIIAGCGNAHVFIAQLFCFFLIAILKVSKKISFLPHYTLYSFSGILIGGLILMFAPGNFSRLEYSGLEIRFDINHFLNYWTFQLSYMLSYLKYIWIIFFLISFSYLFIFKRKFVFKKKSFLILIIGFVSIVSLSLSPVYHNTTNLFFYYCLLIFLISIFKIEKISKNTINFTFIMFFLFSITFQGYFLINQKKICDYSVKLEQIILEEKHSGKQNIKVKQIDINTNRFINYQALFDEKTDPRNQGVAKYYDIQSIIAIK